jgi:hypothetical protein
MGLVRVLSNNRTGPLLQRLTNRDWRQVQRKPPLSRPAGKLKFGTVSGAVMAVLAEAGAPMRYVEIRAAVEERLGVPVPASSVKQFLSDETRKRRPRFERIDRGCYRLL